MMQVSCHVVGVIGDVSPQALAGTVLLMSAGASLGPPRRLAHPQVKWGGCSEISKGRLT